jgi:hypothetical protein
VLATISLRRWRIASQSTHHGITANMASWRKEKSRVVRRQLSVFRAATSYA